MWEEVEWNFGDNFQNKHEHKTTFRFAYLAFFCLFFIDYLFVFVYREHEELVDEYVLELVVVFVNSLGLAHHDEATVGKLWVLHE